MNYFPCFAKESYVVVATHTGGGEYGKPKELYIRQKNESLVR